ncbi:MAG: SMI1/KNR4 family protein [Pontibacterium sp.]
MQDILDALREHQQATTSYVELPDEDDFVRVQEEILIHVPREFQYFLSEAGDIILGAIELASANDNFAHNYLPELCANYWQLGLPRHLIPICASESPMYAISQEGEVIEWDVRTQEQGESWENIWYWARDCWLEQA